MKKYDLPYPKWANDRLTYFTTTKDYDDEEYLIKNNSIINALDEVINYSMFFTFNIRYGQRHAHYFEDVVRNLYLYPNTFHLTEEDKSCYSKQEIEYLMFVQKFLLFVKRKDTDRITESICDNDKAAFFKETRRIYFDNYRCTQLIEGKTLKINLFANEDNFECLLINGDGEVLGLMNATLVINKNKKEVTEDDIDFAFLGYETFEFFKQELFKSSADDYVSIYKLSLKKKY